MTITAAVIRKMAEKGLTASDIAELCEMMEDEKPTVSSGALRQRRYRERKACDVTSDVTRDVTDVTEPPLPLAPPPQTPPPHTPTPPDITTHTRKPDFAKPNGFARFWEAYPNKVGKAAAEKAYVKACRAVTGSDPPGDAILAGVERAKRSRAWIEGYIPHPTTWLNRGSWEDQPSETPIIELRPQNPNVPRPDDKRLAREANLARAFAGSEMAAGRRT